MYHNSHRNLGNASTRIVALALLLSLTSGCVTPWEKSALLKDKLPNISGVQGPSERSLRNWFKKNKEEEEEVFGKSLKPIAGTEQYVAAEELFKDEKYAAAQKAFKKVSKKFKKSEIREDALFMQAESAYRQDHYSNAHDTYAVLLKEYPSTRHMNIVAERLFKIGMIWLEDPDVVKLDEIEQVNYENPTKPKPSEERPKKPTSGYVFVPNFRDKKRPIFDTPGNGVAALTAVWMNDPTGPLADDAMMLVASYNARKGNYVEAERHFRNLRELYPNSPHVQDAFVLGAHVTAMCYQGPEYETRPLQDAEVLKRSILRLYPNSPEADRIRDELARMEEEKAQVLWKQALFYQGKGIKRASAIYCHELISQYPDSTFANKAKAKLVEFGPEFESGGVFLTCDEVKNPTLAERILEPTPPEWMKNPATLVARRKPPKSVEKTDDTVATNRSKSSKSKTTQASASDDDDVSVDEEKPKKVATKPTTRPRRMKSVKQASEEQDRESDE